MPAFTNKTLISIKNVDNKPLSQRFEKLSKVKTYSAHRNIYACYNDIDALVAFCSQVIKQKRDNYEDAALSTKLHRLTPRTPTNKTCINVTITLCSNDWLRNDT